MKKGKQPVQAVDVAGIAAANPQRLACSNMERLWQALVTVVTDVEC
jgi:hypothetical protein